MTIDIPNSNLLSALHRAGSHGVSNAQQQMLSAAIEQIRLRYLSRLREYAAQLRVAHNDLTRDGADGAALEQVELIAHRISGTADSFGCAALGRQARATETCVREGQTGAPVLAALDELVKKITALTGESRERGATA